MYLGVTPLRRFLVYIIDIGLIAIIASGITLGVLYGIKYDFDRYNQLGQNIVNNYYNIMLGRYNDTITNDIVEYFQLYMIREGIRLGFTFILYVLYLVVFQYFYSGQTLGRMAAGVKVVEDSNPDGRLSLGKIILRELVGSFIFYNLISIIGFISMIFAIASGKSLVDRLSKTSMVFKEKIPVNEEIKKQFFNSRFYQNDNEYTTNEYQENEYDNRDYIDAEVKDVNDNTENVDNTDNNSYDNSDDNDDEYRVI